MKPIVAQAGDTVDLSGQGIAVNGKLLPNTAPLRADTHGRPLVAWTFGRYRSSQIPFGWLLRTIRAALIAGTSVRFR